MVSILLSVIKASNTSFSQVTVDKILNAILKRVLKIKIQSIHFFSGKIHKRKWSSERPAHLAFYMNFKSSQ